MHIIFLYIYFSLTAFDCLRTHWMFQECMFQECISYTLTNKPIMLLETERFRSARKLLSCKQIYIYIFWTPITDLIWRRKSMIWNCQIKFVLTKFDASFFHTLHACTKVASCVYVNTHIYWYISLRFSDWHWNNQFW